jgi:hypothetical protein
VNGRGQSGENRDIEALPVYEEPPVYKPQEEGLEQQVASISTSSDSHYP